MNNLERLAKIERWEKAKVKHTTDAVFSGVGMVLLRFTAQVVNLAEGSSASSYVGIVNSATGVGAAIAGVATLVAGSRAFRDAHAIEALQAGNDFMYQQDFAQYEPAPDSE